MCFNYSKLKGLIKEKGFIQSKLAEKIGISSVSLNKKLNNQVEFTQSEMKAIAKELDIRDSEYAKYFFTPSV